MINRVHHWCSVGTGKSQPEGPPFQWETRLAEFPTGTVDPWVGIFLSTLNISEQFFFSLNHQRIVLQMTPSLYENESFRGNEQKKKKKNSAKSILVPICSFCSNKENAYSHLIFLFTNKGAYFFTQHVVSVAIRYFCRVLIFVSS